LGVFSILAEKIKTVESLLFTTSSNELDETEEPPTTKRFKFAKILKSKNCNKPKVMSPKDTEEREE